MKKFWEKVSKAWENHNIVKIAAVMVIFAGLLTWLIPAGSFHQGQMIIAEEITRLGISDFFEYIILGMAYFAVFFSFVFVLGAFYQVLSKVGAYQRLTTGIAKSFKNREYVFVVLTSFLFAIFAALTTEYIILAVFIPFAITIVSKMKLSKMTAFAVTFGSVLIGLLGSLYSSQFAGMNVNVFRVDYSEHLWIKIAILVSAFVVFNLYNILHVKKTLANKKAEAVEDPFVNDEPVKKAKVWPLVVIGGLFVLITILAFIPWYEAFEIELFQNWHEAVLGFELSIPRIMSNVPIFAYILGDVPAFGEWSLLTIQVFMLVTMLIIKCSYKVKTDEFLSSIGEGLKKTAKLAGLLLLIHAIIVITMYSQVIPTTVDWLMNRTEGFSLFFGFLSGMISSIFTIKYQFVMQLIGSYFSVSYSDLSAQLAVLFQAIHGFVSFFAPTSLILLVGLFYSKISYKEWLKYIWQFLLIMFVIMTVIMIVIF